MFVGVLGAVIARDEIGRTLAPAGPVRRQLLAALAARAGQGVAAETLIEDLWGVARPPSARKTLQGHVARLRRDLASMGEDVLVTEGRGYRLAIPALAVDSCCFERDLFEGTRALAANDAQVAWRELEAALSWWRGEAYADVADAPFASAERARLHELRALAHERRIDAGLRLGRGASLVGDIEARLLLEPLRERLWEQLVIALYRADRQADALAAFRRARAVLVEGLGVEPGSELRQLEGRVLAQDETLRAVDGHLDVAGAAPLSVDVVPACPYLGLAEYQEADAALFVARERLIRRLVDRLGSSDLLVLTGDSGAGKSSTIRAGLLPALRAGALPGSTQWTVEVIRPANLTRAAEHAPTDRSPADLVIVDQAEELFTLDAAPDPDQLDLAIASISAHGTRLVLVIRADFYGRLAELPHLAERAGAATEIVGPLSEEELRRVITEPARRVGLEVEPELTEQLLADVSGQPGALPLVSVALLRTWQKRHGSVLSVSAYDAAGGVRSAIEATAEDAYAELTEDGRAQARRLLVRLATRHGGVWTRQPLPRERLGSAAPLVAADTLELLARRRILTLSTDRVELVHEALLGYWPRLRGWLEERAAVADLADTLAVTSQAWADGGRRESDLARGARLHAALDWQSGAPQDVSPLEAEFLAASDRAAHGELAIAQERAAREAHGRRRLRYVVAVLALTAITAVAGGFIAVRERGAEQRAALVADARRVAALSLTAPDLRTSLLLAVAAYRLNPSPDARGALLSALQRSGTALWRVSVPGRPDSFGVDAAGTQFWTMDSTRVIHRYDLANRRQVASFPAHAAFIDAFSPDGRLLVVAGRANYFDAAGAGRVTVLNAANGHTVRVLPVHSADVGADAALTGDGRWLAVVEGVPGDPTDPTALRPSPVLAVFAMRDIARPPRLLRLGAPIDGLAAGQNGFAVVTGSGQLELLRASDLAVTAHATHADLVHSGLDMFALSGDGAHLAVILHNDAALPYLLDTRHLGGPLHPMTRLDAAASALAFSPTGQLLAISASNGSVEVVHATDGSLAARPLTEAAGAGQANLLAWSGTASRDTGLYAAGVAGQVIALDVAAGPRLVTPRGSAIPEPDEAAPAFGHIQVTGPGVNGASTSTYPIRVVDPETGTARTFSIPIPSAQTVQNATLDAAADRLLLQTQGADAIIHTSVIALPSGAVVGRFDATGTPSRHNTDVGILAPDGRTAVYAIGPHRLAVVGIPDGRRLRTIDVHFRGPDGDQRWVTPLTYAPDGRVLVTGFDVREPSWSPPAPIATASTDVPAQDHLAGIVNLHSGRLDGQIGGFGVNGLPDSAAWSPDGTRLVIGTVAGTIRLVDARDLSPLSDVVQAAAGVVQSTAFAPDDTTVVSGGSDGTMAFWDSRTLQPLGSPIRAQRQDSWWVWYTKAGAITGYTPAPADGTMRWFTMPGRADQWIAAACTLAGSSLTRSEWGRYVGSDRPYRPLC